MASHNTPEEPAIDEPTTDAPRSSLHQDAPELAADDYPEAVPPNDPELNPNGPPLGAYADSPIKPEQAYYPTSAFPPQQGSYVPSGFTGYPSGVPTSDENAAAAAKPETAPRRILGCTLLVFILSAIIALLSAAVIGLAAGTGVASSRANNVQSRLDDALGAAASTSSRATVTRTVTAASATATADASTRDRGCSENAEEVTGTNYTTQCE